MPCQTLYHKCPTWPRWDWRSSLALPTKRVPHPSVFLRRMERETFPRAAASTLTKVTTSDGCDCKCAPSQRSAAGRQTTCHHLEVPTRNRKRKKGRQELAAFLCDQDFPELIPQNRFTHLWLRFGSSQSP